MSTRDRAGWAASFIAAFAALLPSVLAATQVADLEGTLEFSAAASETQTNAATQQLSTLYVADAEKSGLVGQASGSAENVSVAWSVRKWTGVGSRPDRPQDSLYQIGGEPQSGSRSFGPGSVRIVFGPAQGAAMIVPRPGSRVTAEADYGDSSVFLEPSGGETWSVGEDSNRTISAGAPLLKREAQVDPGRPVARSHGPVDWWIRGDFTLHLWGGNATIRGEDGAGHYRSGAWWENATAPQAGSRGAARDEYSQLVEVELRNATILLRHQSGLTQWSSDEARFQTQGTVSLTRATGRLVSSNQVFEVDAEPLVLRGEIVQWISGSGGSSTVLTSDVQASGVEVSLAPSETPSARGWPGTATAFASLVLALATGIAWLASRGRRRDFDSELEDATAALRRFDPKDAIRRARGVLRRSPHHPDAWFILGMAWLQERRYALLADKLGSEVSPHDPNHCGLAFLVGLSFAKRGRWRPALRWARVAARDPSFARQIAEEPDFRPLLPLLPSAARVDPGLAYS